MIQKIRFAAYSLAALMTLSACGGSTAAPTQEDGAAEQNTAAEQTELTVFAAASLTESLTAIKETYETAHPEIELIFNFDSSGTLKTQIEEGADCDVFISAGQKQMNALEELITADSRVDLLKNTVVLVAPKAAQNPPQDFTALNQVDSIALGNSDVPVGQYSQEILEYLGIWDKLNADGKITFGSNVKEVTAQVAAGAVDCGIVYRTDAASEPDVVVTAEAPADSYSPAIYPAAVLKDAPHPEEAQAFLDYLQTDDAMQAFSAVGFDRP